MFRYFFAVLVLLHGLIHTMGFAKAFGYAEIAQLSGYISKAAGIVWLMAAAMLVITFLLLLLKKEKWALVAIIAVLLSQILIITVWKDARFGTILNVMILAAAVSSLAEMSFNSKVRKEVSSLLNSAAVERKVITKDMLGHLPLIVQKWLIAAGVIGKERIDTVRLKQQGEMRTGPGKNWMPFSATEYFSIQQPAFNWQTKVQVTSILNMTGRDRFEKGNGAMLIRLNGLINIANKKNEDRINHSAMMRFLAEICWFPTAALAEYIEWKGLDAASAEATMHYKGITASGIFNFDTNGDMISFTGNRWYTNGKHTSLEKWLVQTNGYAVYDGWRVPARCEVSWKLNKGDFNWLYLRVTNLEFNTKELYR